MRNVEGQVQAGLARLAPLLSGSGGAITRLERMSAGASQEIWRFAVTNPQGEHSLILRREPDNGGVVNGGIPLNVEAMIVRAAEESDVPVATVRHILTAEDALGTGYIMDFVEGETLGGRIATHPRFESARAGLARQCGEILARVHAMPLGDLPPLARRSPAEAVEFWRETYRAGTVPRPVFELAFRWLAEHAPSPVAEALVHGDLRNGNLMVDESGIKAVLDWELAHIGDPMEDLGWLCVNSWRFGQIDRPVGGFGDYADLFAGYEAVSGVRVDPERQRWWELFGTLRWGTMCAGSLNKFRNNGTSVERALIARRASETEIDILRLLER